MSSPTDAHLERLVRALAALPDDRAAEVVEEAWQQAADNVRETLAAAMEATLLRRAITLVEADSGKTATTPAAPPTPEPASEGPDGAVGPSKPGAATSGPAASSAAPSWEPAARSSERAAPSSERAAPSSEPATAPSDPVAPPASDPAVASGAPPETASVWYAYAVIDADASAPLDDVTPMDPQGPVQAVESHGLVALASAVPASEFGPEALQERLYDPDWLGQAARRHDEALRCLLGLDAFVPLRFCTIIRNRDDLGRFLDEHAPQLRMALDEVAGRSEWGLKVSTDPERLHAHLKTANDEIAALEGQMDGQSGGKAYFLEKRMTQLLAEESEELATHEAGLLHERLRQRAARSQLLPLQRQADELGGAAQMVLNGAYLVADEDWDGFEHEVREAAERWAQLGLVVELSGPWPPYSFVDLDLAADAAR